jgi:hypothetical protein
MKLDYHGLQQCQPLCATLLDNVFSFGGKTNNIRKRNTKSYAKR